MKFYKIVVLTIIILLIPSISWSAQKDEVIVEALATAGADIQGYDIADWSMINREFMDFDSMEEQRDDILEIFDVKKQNFLSTKEYDEMYRILLTEGLLDSDTFFHMTLQSVCLPEEYEREPQTYLVINISGKNPEKMGVFLSKIREAITLSKGKSKITSCVTGSFNGKLDRVYQNQVIDEITEYLEINDIREVKDEYVYSLVGESTLFAQGINILDKNYNVNIAMRYNSEDDITYIWLGTPIISIDY